MFALIYIIVYFLYDDAYVVSAIVSKSMTSVTIIVVNFKPVKQQVTIFFKKLGLWLINQDPEN
jgi:hypothetical protein